jgi:pimeloyl-ACP methyl ester carboxylesterase
VLQSLLSVTKHGGSTPMFSFTKMKLYNMRKACPVAQWCCIILWLNWAHGFTSSTRRTIIPALVASPVASHSHYLPRFAASADKEDIATEDTDGFQTTTATTIDTTNDSKQDKNADDGDTSSSTTPTLVRIQRKFETFLWRPRIPTSGNNKDRKEAYKINYRVEGPADGPPILLVHGFGANVNHFRYQFPALVSAGYRIYAVDLLGFGASDKPSDAPYSIELFRDLLVDFINAIEQNNLDNGGTSSKQQQPWFLAGNSIGGLCCLAVANALPADQVQGIVLFNCSGGMSGFRYEDVPVYIRPFLYLLQKVVLNPAFGGKSFFANFKTRENVESILKEQGVYRDTTNVDEELLEILLGPSDDKGAEDVFLSVFGGPPGPTPESLLPNITCPILAQWGDSYVNGSSDAFVL